MGGSLIGGLVAGAGSLFGASESSSAAKAAANAQVQAAQIAAQTQQGFFNTAQNDLAPYMATGSDAAGKLTNQLDSLTAATPVPTMTQSDLEATPGYQFTLGQGLKSTQNSAAARGLGASGAAMKGAAGYATGLSDSTYDTRFNQAQTQFQDQQANETNAFNKLYQTAGLGASSGDALAGDAVKTGAGIAGSETGAGNATAAGTNAAGQATAAGITGATSSFNNALQSYLSGSTSKGLYGALNGGV